MTTPAEFDRDERAAALTRALDRLRSRIEAACTAAGRRAEELTVVAVTKTYPVEDVSRLARLGVTDVGESRVGELTEKVSATAGLRWHYLGRLQSRQVPAVAALADVVHSLDRTSTAQRLGRAAVAAGRTLPVFVQLSFDGDPARGGVIEAELFDLADEVAGTEGLDLAGVMAVPPLGADSAAAYRRLAAVAARMQRLHPGATGVSAGMSGDLEDAVAAGATHLRIGTALLGRRAPAVG